MSALKLSPNITARLVRLRFSNRRLVFSRVLGILEAVVFGAKFRCSVPCVELLLAYM